MKKILITILALIYLATTTGATLYMHYCMGEVYAVNLVEKEGCTKCGMAMNEDCCKDEFKIIKINDSHQLISNEINFDPSYAYINNYYKIFDPVAYHVTIPVTTNNNSPPQSQDLSRYILHCVFRL